MGNVVEVHNLSKDFKLPHEKYSSLKQTVVNWNKRSYESFHVLKNINFEVKEGEFFGIVGRNGSGKSTLLKLLAGIYAPTSGSVKINGRLTPFIELGVGFNMDLTGRDNVFLNGILLGLTKEEVRQKYDEIVEYAELEKFMDQKLKNYSSGMQVRLAFSIAIQAHADVLLVDEVLAVGDTNFQRKCFEVFKDIKKRGKTVIFVSHDMGAVREYCDRAVLLDNGKIVFEGKSDAIAKHYDYLNLAASEKELNKRNLKDKEVRRWGNRAVEITKIETLSANKHQSTFSPEDQIEIQVTYEAKEAVESPVFGVTIKNLDGLAVFATNTKAEEKPTPDLKPGDKVVFSVELDNAFNDGTYLIAPAVASTDTRTFYDWIEEAYRFQVGGWPLPFGVVQAKHRLSIKKGAK